MIAPGKQEKFERAIVNFSRTWGLMVKDYISNKHAEHKLSEAELIKSDWN